MQVKGVQLPMDSDLFDDILVDNTMKTARAGGKFVPKAKPRPVKRGSGAPSLSSSQPVRASDVSESEFNAFCEKEKQAVSDDHENFVVVNAPSKPLASTENVDSIEALGPVMDVFMPGSNEDWHSCFDKSVGESTDIFIGLESLGDFLPDSTTVLDNSVPSSETPSVHVSGSRDAVNRPASPIISAVDDSVCISNIPNISTQSESSAAQDPLTGTDAVISTSGSLTDNRSLGRGEMETHPYLETLDMSELTTSSGRRSGKFQPKSKMQAHKQGSEISIPNMDLFEPFPCQQDSQSVPREIDVINRRSVTAFTPDDVLDLSSVELNHSAPAQSTSEVLADEDSRNLMGASHQEAGISGEDLEAVPDIPGKLASRRAKNGKNKAHAVSDHPPKEQRDSTSSVIQVAGRSLRPRKQHINAHQLVDESEDEGVGDGDLPAKSLINFAVNGDDNTDEEFQMEDESQTEKVQKKSKKPTGDKEKPIRKRKKDAEGSDQAAKAAPKKFCHSTRRRKVDKALLETPEDEIDFQKVPLRDLILLADYKERMAKKEAATSQAPPPKQSTGRTHDNEDQAANGFERYAEDEAFVSEQGGEGTDEQESPTVQESSGYFNYQTYMDKTPVVRWSKQDTELFYEGVLQFGTDLSMIQQLFPGRTRKQVKLKYKKEERQHPLRLREALSNRAKDHSHFELVIERLKQIASEEKQNSGKADSISLMGEEEAEEETHETNDEEAKSEQIDAGDVDNMKPDLPETHSPAKSYDSEDDFFRWSQYKSEI